MKKSLILITTLALVFSLSACGNDDPLPDTNDPDTGTMEPTPDTTDPLTPDSTMDDGYTISPPNQDILGDGTMPNSAPYDSYGMSGDDSIGVPYSQMLENANVHDSDGILTDGENSQSDLF